MTDKLNIIKGTLSDEKLYKTLIAVAIGLIIYQILKITLNRINGKDSKNDLTKKRKTYLRLLSNTLKYIFLLIIIIIILKINGINVTSIIAGLGLFSVIAGLALQDALKDIIMGFNIIVDNYFKVGDILKIGNVEGKVIELGLKATKLKDINTGNTYTIANRNISEALVLSNLLYIELPLPYELKITKAEKLFENLVEFMKQVENVQDAKYIGLQKFSDSAIIYKFRIKVEAELIPQTRRNINAIIKHELERNNINIPYTQIDIHTK